MRNLITIQHANFEFSTLSTVGGVGFRDKEIYTHSEFYIIVDYMIHKVPLVSKSYIAVYRNLKNMHSIQIHLLNHT